MNERPRPSFRVRLRRRIRGAVRVLLEERSSPRMIGLAVAWGVIVGTCPLWGFQNLIALGTATLFRLNRVAVLTAAQITMPPFTVVIIYLQLQVGRLARTGAFLDLSFGMLRDEGAVAVAKRLFLDLAIGSAITSPLLGVALGLFAARAAARAQRPRGPSEALTRSERAALLDRLDWLPTSLRHYGSMKTRMDPLYPLALEALRGRRRIADLGGGIGLLAALVQERIPEAEVDLVEWDAKKAKAARTLLAGDSAVRVVEGDARTFEVDASDAVVLADVLHYLPIDEQRDWLTRIARTLPPGGRIVVRDLDPEAGRSVLAERIERWMVRLGWNRGGGVTAWPISEMGAALEAEGLEVRVQPAGKGAFAANALLVADKLDPDARAPQTPSADASASASEGAGGGEVDTSASKG